MKVFRKEVDRLPGFVLGVLDGSGSMLEQRISLLMDRRAMWGVRSRWVAGAVCVSVMGMASAGVGMVGARTSAAQSAAPEARLFHVTGSLPTYEVVTVKPSSADSQDSVTAMRYIQLAFGLPHNAAGRVTGAPAWIDKDYFVIHAKLSDAMRDATAKMTPIQRGNNDRLLRQALLRDRFGMRTHFETREMPVWELVVAKGGLKAKVSPPPSASDEGKLPPIPPAGTALKPSMLVPGGLLFQTKSGQVAEMAARANTMHALATALTNESELGGKPIIDETGLAGTYDFAMEWAPERLAGVDGSSGANAASLFTAMQEQLGLKLVAGKRPVEVVVIDHMERPSEN